MNELIKRSYKAIEKRGLITSTTKNHEFIDKIKEEFYEALYAYYDESEQRYIEELVDIATVCIMQIEHLKYNFINEFEQVVIKNETRTD